jgi:predicted lipoprotein with Yx(FWY)xxD motif
MSHPSPSRRTIHRIARGLAALAVALPLSEPLQANPPRAIAGFRVSEDGDIWDRHSPRPPEFFDGRLVGYYVEPAPGTKLRPPLFVHDGPPTSDTRALDCAAPCPSGRSPLLSIRRSDCALATTRAVLVRGRGCAPAGFSLIRRHDRKRQWAWQGRPLYYYATDYSSMLHASEPGWSPVAIARYREGELVDESGTPLLARTPEAAPCDEGCLAAVRPYRVWPFLEGNTIAGPEAFEQIELTGGGMQWTYRGEALFVPATPVPSVTASAATPEAGKRPEQTAAPIDGKAALALAGPGWRLVHPDLPPATFETIGNDPADVDAATGVRRRYLTSTTGMALLVRIAPGAAGSVCAGACARYFTPYRVNPDNDWIAPGGAFSVITQAGGERVWAWQGRALYQQSPSDPDEDVAWDRVAREHGLRFVIRNGRGVEGPATD